ncbi:hypothetical protein M404DRAFT_1002207 [Pisolithus tinctorius Marx 270]|uniref:Uncharacterized protein n=1 Tax=Pisolithus tinctorius Marx 270 TaxID=870435 RepID=A0A0C3J0H7_PISTI|nr:hypothetical protein M404DRAFT_1002207 [Pisolithus tinctorius Marx 270]
MLLDPSSGAVSRICKVVSTTRTKVIVICDNTPNGPPVYYVKVAVWPLRLYTELRPPPLVFHIAPTRPHAGSESMWLSCKIQVLTARRPLPICLP